MLLASAIVFGSFGGVGVAINFIMTVWGYDDVRISKNYQKWAELACFSSKSNSETQFKLQFLTYLAVWFNLCSKRHHLWHFLLHSIRCALPREERSAQELPNSHGPFVSLPIKNSELIYQCWIHGRCHPRTQLNEQTSGHFSGQRVQHLQPYRIPSHD
jgi:hypothetical protein